MNPPRSLLHQIIVVVMMQFQPLFNQLIRALTTVYRLKICISHKTKVTFHTYFLLNNCNDAKYVAMLLECRKERTFELKEKLTMKHLGFNKTHVQQSNKIKFDISIF